eukprot:s810_g27.t1
MAKKNRNEGQYRQQVRDLVGATGCPQLRRLNSMVAVHYSQVCLKHLKRRRGRTRFAALRWRERNHLHSYSYIVGVCRDNHRCQNVECPNACFAIAYLRNRRSRNSFSISNFCRLV